MPAPSDDDCKAGYWNTWFDTASSGYEIERALHKADYVYTFSNNAFLKSGVLSQGSLADSARVELYDSQAFETLTWS